MNFCRTSSYYCCFWYLESLLASGISLFGCLVPRQEEVEREIGRQLSEAQQDPVMIFWGQGSCLKDGGCDLELDASVPAACKSLWWVLPLSRLIRIITTISILHKNDPLPQDLKHFASSLRETSVREEDTKYCACYQLCRPRYRASATPTIANTTASSCNSSTD